jgi:hypothetical protein
MRKHLLTFNTAHILIRGLPLILCYSHAVSKSVPRQHTAKALLSNVFKFTSFPQLVGFYMPNRLGVKLGSDVHEISVVCVIQ